jgi:hypothetical protein
MLLSIVIGTSSSITDTLAVAAVSKPIEKIWRQSCCCCCFTVPDGGQEQGAAVARQSVSPVNSHRYRESNGHFEMPSNPKLFLPQT